MKEISITPLEEGQRLDRLLSRYLNEAPKSFLYKMLRKKNITLNDRKADGSEKLKTGDSIKIWFSEDTLTKFHKNKYDNLSTNSETKDTKQYPSYPLDIVYEDKDVLFVNKPAGMLSQKAAPRDVSLCEYLIGYLLETGKITPGQLAVLHPSVCNRLDRNTTGLVACGLSAAGLKYLSRQLRERSVHKYYRCIVKGEVAGQINLNGWLIKDEKTNTVKISEEESAGASHIITAAVPIEVFQVYGKKLSLLEVELITGKTHQIRAHLASIGHPILGDPRYGDTDYNTMASKMFHVRAQLLHAYRMEFMRQNDFLPQLSGKVIIAPLPEAFASILYAKERSNGKI